jgi:type II secretory pathway pseudopilin PulG
MTPANDNRTDEAANGWLKDTSLFAVISAVVVGLTILAAVAVSDPPWVVRDLKADQSLVTRLNAIQQSIANYRRTESKLPVSLADLLASPQTTPYGVTADNLKDVEYSVGADGHAYTLCAQFLRPSGQDAVVYSQAWKHEAGRQCFPLKGPDK